MNNAVKGLMGLSIFGAGFGIGWLVAKKHYSKVVEEELAKINKEVEEEMAQLRVRRANPGMLFPQDTEGVDVTEIPEDVEDVGHDPNKDYKDDPFEGMSKEEVEEAREHHRKVITDYTSMYKPSLNEVAADRGILHNTGNKTYAEDPNVEADYLEEEYEDAETDEERELREGEALGRVNHEYPYIIEPEQYDGECEHYDKLDLFYYVKDDSLIDENDTPIDDTDDYLDAISKLQNQTNVYVRNERIGADYAIHRMNRSYKEDVLGVMETPREREFRHLARRKTVMDGED